MFNDKRMINYDIVVAQIIVLPFNIPWENFNDVGQ